MAELQMIPLDQIRVNPVALREVSRNNEDFIQLTDSIRLKGVTNAISVRRKKKEGAEDDGKEFELIDGLQRFTAACEVGSGVLGQIGIIPAQILEQDDAQALETQIIANAHRINTKPVEYARAIMRLLALNPTWTEAELARSLAKSPQWLNKQLGLLKLSDQIKPLVDDGKIPVANAYVLAKLPQDEQANWIERAMTMQASEFGAQCLERAKQIKDANRAGAEAAPEQFTPTAHLRKKTEIEDALNSGLEVADVLIQELGISDAKAGFELGVKWVLNLDPKSVEATKAKYDADKKRRDEDRAKREAERQEKRAADLADKQKEAADAAAAARAAAGQPATA